MDRLADLEVGELQEALEGVENNTPTQRLIAAIAYKHGITQSELANWFGVERKTIYNWFRRFEQRPLEEAIYEEERPGRPRKLDEDELAALQMILTATPSAVGFDVPTWTVEAVQSLLRDRFDVEYSPPSCRRLMKEAGLRYRHVGEDDIEMNGRGRESCQADHRERKRAWVPTDADG